MSIFFQNIFFEPELLHPQLLEGLRTALEHLEWLVVRETARVFLLGQDVQLMVCLYLGFLVHYFRGTL